MQNVKKIVTNNRSDLRGVMNDHPTGTGNLERKYPQASKDKKRYRISCSLNQNRYKKFLRYAEAYGARPATLFQEIVFSYLDKKRMVLPALNEKITRIINLTGRISNNISQLRHFAHNETELFYLDKCKKKIMSFEDTLEVFINKADHSSFLEKRTEQLLTYIKILANRFDKILKHYRATENDLKMKDIGKVEDVMKHLNTAITNFINYSVSVRTDQ